jgi:hypothetical protein
VSDQLQAALAVCELANLALPDGVEPFAIDNDDTAETSDPNDMLCALRKRLRYQPLTVTDLNWALCAFIGAVLEGYDEHAQRMLRQLAVAMTHHGHSSTMIVALLAAGHEPIDALDATRVLAAELSSRHNS